MNIKHRNLEVVRRSPQSAVEFSSQKSKGGATMVRVWDYAVGHYHKEQDFQFAFNYLLNGLSNFNNTKKNREHRDELLEKFKMYTDSFSSLDFTNLSVNSRLRMPISHNNFVTGEILRVDKTSEDGFAITVQNRNDDIWAHELRFRLLQIHYSNVYKCPYDTIKVGVYNFESSEHEYTSFDESELNLAWEEVTALSNKINRFSL